MTVNNYVIFNALTLFLLVVLFIPFFSGLLQFYVVHTDRTLYQHLLFIDFTFIQFPYSPQRMTMTVYMAIILLFMIIPCERICSLDVSGAPYFIRLLLK